MSFYIMVNYNIAYFIKFIDFYLDYNINLFYFDFYYYIFLY